MGKLQLHVSTRIRNVFTTVKSQRNSARNTKPERVIDYSNKYDINRHQKCILCTETEHFPDGTHKTVFRDHKTTLSKDVCTVTHKIQHHMQLTHKKTHPASAALCTPFSLCSVQLLVVRMVADGMNNIKCAIYSF
jgi:hypothetical protein